MSNTGPGAFLRDWSDELVNGYKSNLARLRLADASLSRVRRELAEREAIVSEQAMIDGKIDTARKSLAAAATASDKQCEFLKKAVEDHQLDYNHALGDVKLDTEQLQNFRAIMKALGGGPGE